MYDRVTNLVLQHYREVTVARFNKSVLGPKTLTINRGGGEAYEQTPELQLISLMLCSFLKDQFYSGSQEQLDRIVKLTDTIKDKEFLAKLAIYARDKFHMRSVTHVLAALIANQVKGSQITPKGTVSKQSFVPGFIDHVVQRVDDATEILGFYLSHCEPKVPNNLKKGLGRSLGKFSAYQLAKYKAEGKAIKLIDLVNLCHPPFSAKNGAIAIPVEAIKEAAELTGYKLEIKDCPTEDGKLPMRAMQALVLGLLKSFDTWESGLAAAGEKAKEVAGEDASEEALAALKTELKGDVFRQLIRDRKIGYFALLRNLRNIVQNSPDALDDALVMLADPTLISKSRVLPFRYITAVRELCGEWYEKRSATVLATSKILKALDAAADASLTNVPVFSGKTVVVLDHSGSMAGSRCMGSESPASIGSLFAAILVKKCNADLIVFSDDAQYRILNSADSLLTLQKAVALNPRPAGTNFNAPFRIMQERYDRIIILSDMQGWMKDNASYFSVRGRPTQAFNDYKKKFRADPLIYSWDLTGYGDMMFPEPNVFCLAGFSSQVFNLMQALETDKNAMIKEIRSIEF